MSYLVFNVKGKKTGDIDIAEQCTSAIFNYQVIGNGAEVEFFGSNVPSEPYRVCRRLNILRDYSDEKTKLYPRN
ncbi:hypothetical protein A7A39_00090 [Acinetobacter baumannii]|nr:hypothetical protein A7A39_00090 [Acinetobacter baumannii]OWX29364.1 hypothetical protein A7A37_00795 [Acinetobacter baumannii]